MVVRPLLSAPPRAGVPTGVRLALRAGFVQEAVVSAGVLPIWMLQLSREVAPWGSSTSCVQILPDIILGTAGCRLPLLQPFQLLGGNIS